MKHNFLASTSILAIDRHVRCMVGALLRELGPGWQQFYTLVSWPPEPRFKTQRAFTAGH